MREGRTWGRAASSEFQCLLTQHGSNVCHDLKSVVALFHVFLPFLFVMKLLKFSRVNEFFFQKHAYVKVCYLIMSLRFSPIACWNQWKEPHFISLLESYLPFWYFSDCCIISCCECLEYSRNQWYLYWDKFCQSHALQIAAHLKYIRWTLPLASSQWDAAQECSGLTMHDENTKKIIFFSSI